MEIQYVVKVFHATYKKFLNAIDHINYHPSQTQSNVTRVKRSEIYNMYGHYHTLYKINPSLHKNSSCMKRVGIFTWILGWRVFSNARNIAKIKDNLHTLQKQNQLQDKQIKQLAKYLNLTMHQVDRP